ncbi:MarR family winged helix-turn-helix transcriptional regulator [Pannonibacter sp. SL95]|jgi:DNA-binding MarR family transcriptional regulator|uniref:MarR family winged helix-turn-helix transcriptional regulator n=1 Tax=Pannonibacter sp. SL95 TaxID=2995153 RepID=UPI002272346E|nr:MarR family transcriptional regulator [Pannonibacter sp. SL95]MCY1708981.1 MarR family transcriptional regulator [Pannonibacter sp. SL95]
MDLEESLRCLQWHMWFRWREESRRSGSMDLTPNELDYLYALLGAGRPIRLGELAARMQVTPASASAMVRKLEARGYISRSASGEDARSVLLAPTPKCQALEAEEQTIYADTASRLAAMLEPQELAELSRLLAKARGNLTTDY